MESIMKKRIKKAFRKILLFFIFTLNVMRILKANSTTMKNQRKVPAYTLPDPLRMVDGREVKNASGWTNGQEGRDTGAVQD
jgi:hypothetical protein